MIDMLRDLIAPLLGKKKAAQPEEGLKSGALMGDFSDAAGDSATYEGTGTNKTSVKIAPRKAEESYLRLEANATPLPIPKVEPRAAEPKPAPSTLRAVGAPAKGKAPEPAPADEEGIENKGWDKLL
jgi:hypothetical protein